MAARSKSKTGMIQVTALRSFNTMYQGETFETENDEATQGYIRGGFLAETEAPGDGSTDGTRTAGPGESGTDIQRGQSTGADDS